jgi:RecQ-mediated genome instability protein 2
MDYTLAALKLFGSQLSGSTTAPDSEGSSAALMLFNIRFQRAWIQVEPSLPLIPFPIPRSEP